MKGKRKKIILTFVILIVTVFLFFRFFSISRSIHSDNLPPLPGEDLVEAGRSGHYPHLLIFGVIYSPGYSARFNIYKNGTGRFMIHGTDYPEQREWETEYIVDDNGEILPGWEWYREFIDSFAYDSQIGTYYEIKLSKSDIKSILTDLGDGSIEYEDIGGYCGNGVSYYIYVAMGGKKTHFSGVSYQFARVDYNLDLYKWMVSELIPLLKNNGEVITSKEFRDIENNYLLLHGLFNPGVEKHVVLRDLPDWCYYLFQD